MAIDNCCIQTAPSAWGWSKGMSGGVFTRNMPNVLELGSKLLWTGKDSFLQLIRSRRRGCRVQNRPSLDQDGINMQPCGLMLKGPR
jgi:hypothetical protein